MHTIHTHEVNGLNEELMVRATDTRGPGGANHCYDIRRRADGQLLCQVDFQYGPISDNGVNGVSNEALLAIVRDRLLGFQNGPYACGHNGMALDAIRWAMMALHKRTEDRLARGVEGTSVV